jgi:hypothetical protein
MNGFRRLKIQNSQPREPRHFKLVSPENYLTEPEGRKRLDMKNEK